MRPHGDIRTALLDAARQLATPHQAPTLRELAHHAQVGHDCARRTVSNLTRYGALRIARQRRVAYRNRPVAEYELALTPDATAANDAATVGLAQLLTIWGHAA